MCVLDVMQLYFNEIGFLFLLMFEEEVYFVCLVQKGDFVGWKWMIESNLWLVVKIVWCYVNCGLFLFDLIEEGNLGLICVVEKFDLECGFWFLIYVIWWICQIIEWVIMNQIWIICLLIYVVKEFNVYLCVVWELIYKFDYEFLFEEIVNLLEKLVVEVKCMFGLNEWVILVDVFFGLDLDKILLDMFIDDCFIDLCELLQDDDFSESIDQWLMEFIDKQCEVVICCFGLCGYESSMLEEVGQEIGLICEWVCQIQVEVLKCLWEILEKNGLLSDVLFQ